MSKKTGEKTMHCACLERTIPPMKYFCKKRKEMKLDSDRASRSKYQFIGRTGNVEAC